MPPLHRMPVFYLALLVVAAAVGLGAWARPSGTRDRVASVGGQGTPVRPATVRVVPEIEPPPAAPMDGVLRTPEGLRRKVLIKDLDVVCQPEPEAGRGRARGSPLDYFAIRFIYGESPPPPARPAMLRIGSPGGSDACWVPAASVLEWDTRLMARPTPRRGRPPLVIFRDESCLLDDLAHRECPRHRGECPREGEERQDGPQASAFGMPILASRAIPRPDGSESTIFRVASLVRDAAPPPPPPASPPNELLPALRRVDIAFVIDTTASMQEPIAAARRLAERLVADASDRHRDVTLRLALVEYRDQSPVFGHKTRIVTRFTDPASFLSALGTIAAARRGDGSVDEAVLDGLEQALPAGPNEPPASEHLNWPAGRSGELETKMLVLLGDAPDHAQDLTRAEELAARARRAGITIATIALDRPAVLSRAEQARYRAQWQTLAKGSFLPRDKARAFSQTVAPLSLRPDESGQLVPMLQALIDDRIEHARDLAALAAAEAEGRLADYVTSQGLTLDQVAPVLVDLHRGGTASAPRPDPRFHGRKAPSVRIGWMAESREGHRLVTVEVLTTRDELGALIDELSQLQLAAQGSARDLSDLIRIGTAAAAGEAGFLAADRGARTFADHLRRRQGFPPARPDSLLRRTQADLLQSDELYRSALNARLSATLSELIRRRNAIDWDDPRRTIDGMALVPYALFDF